MLRNQTAGFVLCFAQVVKKPKTKYSCCNPLIFQEIGKAFITEQSVEYNGTDHVFNGDTFNEMRPKSSSTTYLASVSKAVYEAMAEVDDRAVWLMQGWLFLKDPEFWQPDQIKAYLRGKIRSCNIFYSSNLIVCKSVLMTQR